VVAGAALWVLGGLAGKGGLVVVEGHEDERGRDEKHEAAGSRRVGLAQEERLQRADEHDLKRKQI